MLEIPLSHSRTCLIDEIDFSLIKAFNWRVSNPHNSRNYAFAIVAGRQLLMHRLILGAQKGQIIDHINRNGLDNRRKNLRFCSQSQNHYNNAGWAKRLAKHSVNSPVYKGVWRSSVGYSWEAKICWEGKQRFIGTFPTAEKAAKAYDDYARSFHGSFARLNFPEPGELGVHDKPTTGGIPQ